MIFHIKLTGNQRVLGSFRFSGRFFPEITIPLPGQGLADLLLKITGKYDVGWFNVAESSILVGETDITNLHFAWSNMVNPAFWLLNPSGSCFSEPPKLSNYLSSSVRTGFPASCWASLCKIKGWQGAWACGSSSCFSTGLSEHGHTKKDTLLKLSAPANISFW